MDCDPEERKRRKGDEGKIGRGDAETLGAKNLTIEIWNLCPAVAGRMTLAKVDEICNFSFLALSGLFGAFCTAS